MVFVDVEVGVTVARFGCLAGFGKRDQRVRRHYGCSDPIKLRTTFGISMEFFLIENLLSMQQGLTLLIIDLPCV